MSRAGAFGLALGLLTACTATVTAVPSRSVLVSGPPPDKVVVEERSAPPSPSHAWVPGYWHWTGVGYAWIPGHWAWRYGRHEWIHGFWSLPPWPS